jgi:hypothetical protein
MATFRNLQKTAGKLSSIANTQLPDIQGVVAASADGNIRLVNKTQLPNTIRDIICQILAGGLRNPFEGQLLCLEIALGNLIGTPGMPESLQDQLNTMKNTLGGLLDHLGVNSTIARMQNVINQMASIYSLVNFCDNPVTAPNIGTLLDNALGSLFGPGQSHINALGNIEDVSLCLNLDGSFDFSGLSSGLLKDINDDLPTIIATGVVSSVIMNNLSSWNTDVNAMMVTENAGDPASATVCAAATTASNLYSAHCQLKDYALPSGNDPWSAIANSDIVKNLEQQATRHPVVASRLPVENAAGEITDTFFDLKESGTYNDYVSSGSTKPGTSDGIWSSDISELGGFESNVIAPNLGGTIGATGGSTAGTNPGGGIVPGATGAGGSSTTGTIIINTSSAELDLFLQSVVATPQDGTGLLKKEANKAVLQLVAGESGKVTVVESGDGDPYKTLTVGLDQTFLDSIPNTWTDLTDTPSTITASKFVKSNSGGTALEFVDEADPVFLASAAGTITTAKIANWDEAHGWGNHALAGYLTATEDNTHGNIGSGAKVYDETSANDIKLRTLVAGDGVRIEQRTQDIFISGDEYLLKSRALTTDAGAVQVMWDTSQDGIYSETISPASEECWFFTATFLARRTGGTVERNAFKLEGLVDNTLGTVGLVGPAAKTVYQNNATQWDVSVEVLLDKLVFKVFGEAQKEINWTIHLRYQPASETVNYGLDP